MQPQAEVIRPPARPSQASPSQKTIFLAGTTADTSEPDWREVLTEALSHLPLAIVNPKRSDWESSWNDDWVQWELEMQEDADIIAFVFHSVSAAPISLLELGLCVRSGKAIVCVLDGYSKRGNVEAVCRRYNAKIVGSLRGLTDAIMERLRDEGVDGC